MNIKLTETLGENPNSKFLGEQLKKGFDYFIKELRCLLIKPKFKNNPQ